MRAIIAVNNLGFIGLDKRLLWYSKGDLEHFKNMTINSTLLVGYNTYCELPKLKNRNIILDIRGKELVDINDIDWCIGGRKTYEKYSHLFTELHISHIDDNTIGNICFPDLSGLNRQCKIYNYNFGI